MSTHAPSKAMTPIELMIYAASWQVLAGGMFLLMVTPQCAIDAATEVIRTVPLTRDEFAAFEASLFAAIRGGEGKANG